MRISGEEVSGKARVSHSDLMSALSGVDLCDSWPSGWLGEQDGRQDDRDLTHYFTTISQHGLIFIFKIWLDCVTQNVGE